LAPTTGGVVVVVASAVVEVEVVEVATVVVDVAAVVVVAGVVVVVLGTVEVVVVAGMRRGYRRFDRADAGNETPAAVDAANNTKTFRRLTSRRSGGGGDPSWCASRVGSSGVAGMGRSLRL
jgi:hypothetical protein